MTATNQNQNGYKAQIDRNFIGRSEVAIGALEAVIAGVHILLIGPPGTAKTAFARFLCKLFSLAKQGESASWKLFQFNPFTKPEAITGPLNVKKYTEEGTYEYAIDGYLPTCHFAILDELFKTTPATMHSLLGMLQERQFVNGSTVVDIPLNVAIGISNELPPTEATALFDRFTSMFWIDYAQSPEDFTAIMGTEGDPADNAIPCLSLAKIQELQDKRKKVRVTPETHQALAQTWRCVVAGVDAKGNKVDGLNGGPSYHGGNYSNANRPSDRRFKQALKLVQARALLAKRTETKPVDLLAMVPALWVKPEQRGAVDLVIMSCLFPEWPGYKSQGRAVLEQFEAYKKDPANTDGGHWINHRDCLADTARSIKGLAIDLPEAKAMISELSDGARYASEQAKHYLKRS